MPVTKGSEPVTNQEVMLVSSLTRLLPQSGNLSLYFVGIAEKKEQRTNRVRLSSYKLQNGKPNSVGPQADLIQFCPCHRTVVSSDFPLPCLHQLVKLADLLVLKSTNMYKYEQTGTNVPGSNSTAKHQLAPVIVRPSNGRRVSPLPPLLSSVSVRSRTQLHKANKNAVISTQPSANHDSTSFATQPGHNFASGRSVPVRLLFMMSPCNVNRVSIITVQSRLNEC